MRNEQEEDAIGTVVKGPHRPGSTPGCNVARRRLPPAADCVNRRGHTVAPPVDSGLAYVSPAIAIFKRSRQCEKGQTAPVAVAPRVKSAAQAGLRKRRSRCSTCRGLKPASRTSGSLGPSLWPRRDGLSDGVGRAVARPRDCGSAPSLRSRGRRTLPHRNRRGSLPMDRDAGCRSGGNSTLRLGNRGTAALARRRGSRPGRWW